MTTRLGVRLIAAAVLAMLAVVVLLLTRSAPSTGGASPAPAPLPAVSAQPTSRPSTAADQEASSSSTTGTGTPGSVLTSAGSSESEKAALEAVTAWQADTDRQRTDALVMLATVDFQDAAVTIDATRVPNAVPTTVRTRVEADGQALVDVELEDGTDLAVVLVLEQDRWLLADLRPVNATDDGGGDP